MKKDDVAKDWLKRAKSNLGRAKAGKVSKGVLYEDLCFDCQQAVEKSLKALLININILFPRTHSIAVLIELLEENGIKVPDNIKDAIPLTQYAVTTRYPGDYEPVGDKEYKEAVKIAERAVNWVKKELKRKE